MDIDVFNHRLNKLQDSIFESLTMTYTNEGILNAELSFSCREWSKAEDIWIRVSIKLYGVQKFNLYQEFFISHHVISNGISLVEINDQLILELGDLADTLINIDDLKFSNFYLIAKSYCLTILEQNHTDKD